MSYADEPASGPSAGQQRSATRWIVASVAWSLLVSALLLILPTVTIESCTAGIGGAESCRSRNASLLESEGSSILPVVLVSVLLPAMALMWRSSRRLLVSLGATYLVLATLAILSVGVFYMPAAIALLLAGITFRRGAATSPG